MKHTLYNNQPHKKFQTSRLIFFAEPKKEESERLQTEENKRMCEELGKMGPGTHGREIAKLFQRGKLEEKTFREAYEIAKDPNKTQKDPYKRFMKALAKGKFPKRGKFALKFLNALSGTEKERQYAEDLVRKLSEDSTSPLTSRTEKEHLRELDRLKEEDIKKEAVEKTAAAATTVVQQAETGQRIEELTKVERENWTIEQPPPELIEKLDQADLKMYELAKEEEKLSAQPETERIKTRIKEIDKEIDKTREKTAEIKEEWINYLKRALARFRALRNFSKRAGLDMNAVSQLTIWFLNLDPKKRETTALEGIIVDPKTGKASKKTKLLKINKIYFEKEKTDSTVEAPGELMVEYTQETDRGKSEKVQASYRTFLGLVDTYEGYEKIEDIDEFNEKYAHELGYKDVRELEGQTFSAEVLKDPESEEKVYEKEEFTITKVKQKDGEWIIELDKTCTKTPKQKLPKSVHPVLYFDRTQKEFELGEFGPFLRKNGYQKEIADEEMQEIIDESMAAGHKECEGFIKGATSSEKRRFEAIGGMREEELTIPKPGEEQRVVCLDEYSRKKEAILRTVINKDGGQEYELEYQATGTDGEWGMPEISAAAAAVKGLPGVKEPRVVKRRLRKRHFQEMANKGEIENAPTAGPAGGTTPPSGAAVTEVTEEGEPLAETMPRESGDTGEPEGPKEKMGAKSGFYKEALSYDEIYKAGGMQKVERGFLKAMWTRTRFLSVGDLWEWGKAMYEYYVRRFERRQKERYADVGKDLPFFAPEMKRIKQASENEQVNQFKESFEQMGVFEIQTRLTKTHNRDELKASLMTLTEKGQMRWDDIDFWRNLNKFIDPRLAVPIPSSGDPNTRVSDTDQRTGFDFLKEAIDSLWGEGIYNEWFNKNKGSFQQNAKGYYEEGKQLEGVDGGHERRLAVLLRAHKEGEFVDPHEYEGLILHAIEYGKASMQCKIYYMLEGVAAENRFGRTILSFDRMAHINSEMLIKFPLLEYLCASAKRAPDGRIHRFTIDDYKKWVRGFDEPDPMNSKPNKNVDNFMWKYVIPSDDTQNRINKALRHGENLDHDDMFAYLPPATEQVITDSCKSTTGSKKFLTIEGYANVFPGFSQYMRSLAENDNREKLLEAIKSYVRFEGIMLNRFEKEKDVYQRLDESTLNTGTIVTPTTPPKAFLDECNSAVRNVVEAYGDPELLQIYDLLRETTGDVSVKEEREHQDRINYAFHQFSQVFTRVIRTDNGEKMRSVVAGAPLEGMPIYVSDAEKDKRKAEYSNELGLAY